MSVCHSGFFCDMIHLYNPSTDMALASGRNNYTPPRNVASFERRNMLLPTLYASPGDAVLLLYDFDRADLIGMPFYREGIRLLRPKDLKNIQEPLTPWGWNISLRTHLTRLGYPERLLPKVEEINCWRFLAHRRVSVEVNRILNVATEDQPREFTDPEEAMEYVLEKRDVMLKLPWSSSGRGVLAIHASDYERARKRIEDSISKQKSILIEPLHDRIRDFATEWSSDGKELSFLGYSLFRTDECGRYKGNVISSQEEIVRELSSYTSKEEVFCILDMLKSAVSEVLINKTKYPYKGLLGVDGLISRDRKIVACLEINLRRTMGHVSLDVFSRNSLGGSKILRVE